MWLDQLTGIVESLVIPANAGTQRLQRCADSFKGR
jgi:hypothetical protein